MEFAYFHEFPSLPGRTESEAFDEAMEQTDAAERLGGLPKRPRQWISLAAASSSLGGQQLRGADPRGLASDRPFWPEVGACVGAPIYIAETEDRARLQRTQR